MRRNAALEPHPFDTETASLTGRAGRPAAIRARATRSGSLADGPDQGAESTTSLMSMPEESRRATTRLDPRSPLVLDTRELGRRPGSMRSLSRSVPAPAHLGVDVLGVPAGSPVELDLRLESVVEGVLVSGTVAATMSGECVRCLDPVTVPLVVDLQELYAFPGPATGGARRGRRHGAAAGDER